MGRTAKQHPDELIFELLKSGFNSAGFDGKNFFAANHPVEIDGKVTNFSNIQTGTAPAWFLLDTSRAIRPIIFRSARITSFSRLTTRTRNTSS